MTQIPAGWISTKVGGARVLLAGVAIWSVGTLLAPPAAKMGEHPLWPSVPGPADYPIPSLRPKEVWNDAAPHVCRHPGAVSHAGAGGPG